MRRGGQQLPDATPGPTITLADLPKPEVRWVIRRKSTVVGAVRSGLLTLQEACQRYRLSTEEFLSWRRAVDAHGLYGLRATRVQLYRQLEARRRPRDDLKNA